MDGFIFRLEELLKLNKMTAKELTEKLQIEKTTVSAWKKGRSTPSPQVLLKISEIFGKSVDWLLTGEDTYYNEETGEEEEIIRLPIFNQSASAGRGTYLIENDERETVKFFASEVPKRADFCVRIQGDSMEPEIPDGCVIFVQSSWLLDPGEIGVFIVNDKILCKKLHIDYERRKTVLISLNPAYDPIEITEFDELYSIGRVLSSIERKVRTFGR